MCAEQEEKGRKERWSPKGGNSCRTCVNVDIQEEGRQEGDALKSCHDTRPNVDDIDDVEEQLLEMNDQSLSTSNPEGDTSGELVAL